MEENKDFKAEEITKENQSAVEENELVTEDTEATSKEEAEEIVEEYTENDDLYRCLYRCIKGNTSCS